MMHLRMFRVALLSTSIFIMGRTPSLAMEEEKDKKTSSTQLLKQISSNFNSLLNDYSGIDKDNDTARYQLDQISDDVSQVIMLFLDLKSLNYLSYTNKRLHQSASRNEIWISHLTKNKLTPLLGRAWNTYPPHISSCKSYYAALHLLQNLPKNGEESIERHLYSAILPDSILSHQCLGLLYQMFDKKDKAFEQLYRAGELGDEWSQKQIVEYLYKNCDGVEEEHYQELLSLSVKGWGNVQDKVVEALYEGKFGQGNRTKEERYQTLLSLAEKGWKTAQSRVVDILYEGRFGQDQVFAEERYQKLFTWAESGWYGAQMKVASALYEGTLGQNKKCEEDRYKELEYLTERGWHGAQGRIVDALRGKKGTLGQDKKTDKKRYQELLSLGEKGWENAQCGVMSSIIDGYLDWDKRSGEERYQELFSLAEKKWRIREWDSAQLKVAEALYKGKFDWDKRSEEERYQKLFSLAKISWDGAQEKVVSALYEGTLGQNKRSEDDRYEELEDLAEIGWVSAQKGVAKALYEGKLSQKARPKEERYQRLFSLAKKNLPIGAWEVVQALSHGKLGQDKRSEKERYQDLVTLGDKDWDWAKSNVISTIICSRYIWGSEKEQYEELVSLAERGWVEAQGAVCNAHTFNMVGGTPKRDQMFCSVMEFILSGKSRDVAPAYFKKYKNAKYFQLLRTLIEGKFNAK